MQPLLGEAPGRRGPSCPRSAVGRAKPAGPRRGRHLTAGNGERRAGGAPFLRSEVCPTCAKREAGPAAARGGRSIAAEEERIGAGVEERWARSDDLSEEPARERARGRASGSAGGWLLRPAGEPPRNVTM